MRIHNIARESDQLGYHQSDAPDDEYLVLWLDFTETDTLGTFYSYGSTPTGSGSMNGIIGYNQEPEPEAWQSKRSHAPIRFESLHLPSGKFRVYNRHHFTDLDELEIRWSLKKDGEEIRFDILELQLLPLESKTVTLPLKLTDEPGSHYYDLLVSTHLKHDTPWAEQGYEVTFDEFALNDITGIKPYFWLDGTGGTGQNLNPHETEASGTYPPLQVTADAEFVRISGEDFEYVFDQNEGTIEKIDYKGQVLLKSGPRLNVA